MPRYSPCAAMSRACADGRDYLASWLSTFLPGRFFWPATEQTPAALLETKMQSTLITADSALWWEFTNYEANQKGGKRYDQAIRLLETLDQLNQLKEDTCIAAIEARTPSDRSINLKVPDPIALPSVTLLASLIAVGVPNFIAFYFISSEGVTDADLGLLLAIAAGIAASLNNGTLGSVNTEGLVYDAFEDLIRPFLMSLFSGPAHWSLRFYHLIYLGIAYGILGFGISISGSLFESLMRAVDDEAGGYDTPFWMGLNIWFFTAQVLFTNKNLVQYTLASTDYLGITGGDAGAGHAARSVVKAIIGKQVSVEQQNKLSLMLLALPEPTEAELRDPVSAFNCGLRAIANNLENPWLNTLGMLIAAAGYVIPNSQNALAAILLFREKAPFLDKTTMIHFADDAFEAGLLALPVILVFGPLCVKGLKAGCSSMMQMFRGLYNVLGGACEAPRGRCCESWLAGIGEVNKGIVLLAFTFLTIFTSIATSTSGVINAPDWYAILLEGCKNFEMPELRAFSMNLTATILLTDLFSILLDRMVKALCCVPKEEKLSAVISRKLQHPCQRAVVDATAAERVSFTLPTPTEKMVGHLRYITENAKTATQFKAAVARLSRTALLPEAGVI